MTMMRNAARLIALGRAAFSLVYLAVPSKVNLSWVGETKPVSSSELLGLSLAALAAAIVAVRLVGD